MKVERCWWCEGHDDYIDYHDNEWGRPVDNDITLFEKMSLEGFQSGLSWLTILRKRENFRAAFDGFDFEKIARYTDKDVESLLQNAGIIRHRGKIEATINNAQKICDLIDQEGSFAKFVWSYEPQDDKANEATSEAEVKTRVTRDEAKQFAKDLKKRGFKFFGPTTAYAFMQAMGMVNDHVGTCPQWKICNDLRASFKRP